MITTTVCVAATTALAHTFFAQAPAPHIDGTWLLDLRTITAVSSVVLYGTWILARWMKRIDDRLEFGERLFEAINKRMDARDVKLDEIQKRVDTLPCGLCDPQPKRKTKT